MDFDHGTTTLGFRLQGEVILAVDLVPPATMKKIVKINEYLLETLAGGAADSRSCPTLCTYKSMFISMGMMLAGYDKRGPQLYYIDSEGTHTPGKVVRFTRTVCSDENEHDLGRHATRRTGMVMVHKYGADALRLYLINSPDVRAENLRFKEDGVKDIMKDVFLPRFASCCRTLIGSRWRTRLYNDMTRVVTQASARRT
ncbi:proteasome component PRE2 [Culex quinquefasciatus]|uniref:Proteasome component PRE2 n=1 Tax=Culex quinquefasciatus TaxID=7176 RepID=B0WRG7_CULQU|nr:proteasome component PRE2 [Culex quinquefasciatus]|eukprot:XP_001851301.1 proteasome component PRE2 [Culex quinquefasciatus]